MFQIHIHPILFGMNPTGRYLSEGLTPPVLSCHSAKVMFEFDELEAVRLAWTNWNMLQAHLVSWASTVILCYIDFWHFLELKSDPKRNFRKNVSVSSCGQKNGWPDSHIKELYVTIYCTSLNYSSGSSLITVDQWFQIFETFWNYLPSEQWESKAPKDKTHKKHHFETIEWAAFVVKSHQAFVGAVTFWKGVVGFICNWQIDNNWQHENEENERFSG